MNIIDKQQTDKERKKQANKARLMIDFQQKRRVSVELEKDDFQLV